MTRVVQLANFYSETSGGLRAAVDRLGAAYRAAGHQVIVIVPGVRSRTIDGRTEIGAPRVPNGSGYRVIVSAKAVRGALEAAAPDVIEVHDKLLLPWVSRWARPRGVPVIAISHERLDITLGSFAPWVPAAARLRLARSLARRTSERSDLVVVCSRFAGAEFNGPLAADVRLVPLGVDLDTFRPRGVSEPGGPLRLVSVTRLSAEKLPVLAIDTLAELCRRGVDAELTMIGDGPQRARLGRHASGLPVRFTGFISAPEVAAIVSRADVALAPGPAETFGLAALEALAWERRSSWSQVRARASSSATSRGPAGRRRPKPRLSPKRRWRCWAPTERRDGGPPARSRSTIGGIDQRARCCRSTPNSTAPRGQPDKMGRPTRRSPSARTVRRVSDQEKIGDTWERLRRQERDERDARIRAELEQVERISKAIVEDEST